MADRPDLAEWVDQLPRDAVAVRVRCGSKANPTDLALVALDDEADEVRAASTGSLAVVPVTDRFGLAAELERHLANAGWGTEHATARCHALTLAKGKRGPVLRQAGSWQRTVELAEPTTAPAVQANDGQGVAIVAEALRHQTQAVAGILAQAGNMMAVMSATLEHRESVLADAVEALVEARQGQVDTEAEALAQVVDMAMREGEESEADAMKATALSRAVDLGELYLASKMGQGAVDLAQLDDDQLAAWLADQPALVERLSQPETLARLAQLAAPPPTPTPKPEAAPDA